MLVSSWGNVWLSSNCLSHRYASKMNIGPLRVLAVQETSIAPNLQHIEIYAMSGLLSLFWHGDREATRVVLAGGGALGGVLGPANGLFHDLGKKFAAAGYGWISVGYRRPNDLEACVGDLIAAGMLAERNGAESLITLGHSFGGAVAVGAALPPSPIAELVKGVVTLATQSAGCENASLLAGKPFLLFHGDRDEILPAWASEVVMELAGGHGELRILPGAGHLLTEGETPQLLRSAISEWVFDQIR